MIVKPDIVVSQDGSHTLRHPLTGELYHSLRGAVGESEHVFIRAGFQAVDKMHVRVFEMGFGSGLNALLTLNEAIKTGKKVDYHTVELYPVDPDTAKKLRFVSEKAQKDAFRQMHRSPWNEPVMITKDFRLTKAQKSLADIEFDTIFDVIFFDAFSPDVQPELWTEKIFRKLFEYTAENGILVTYSAKGTVKRALRAAGYEVRRLPGALGKRHMVQAIRKERR